MGKFREGCSFRQSQHGLSDQISIATPQSSAVLTPFHRNDTRQKKGLPSVWQALDIAGAQGQNRTADTRIFSPLLYRLSYLGETGNCLYPMMP